MFVNKQIIAVGGGVQSWGLFPYICQQSGKKKPKVLVDQSANGCDRAAILNAWRRLTPLGCEIHEVNFLFRVPEYAELLDLALSSDIILVGGGNTVSMLAMWRQWGFDKIIRQAYEKGVILAGSSAGGIFPFAQAVTDSVAGKYTVMDGVGIIQDRSFSPHYTEEQRVEDVKGFIRSGKMIGGYAVQEGVGIHLVNGDLVRAVRAGEKGEAYLLEFNHEQLIETPLFVEDVSDDSAKLTFVAQ